MYHIEITEFCYSENPKIRLHDSVKLNRRASLSEIDQGDIPFVINDDQDRRRRYSTGLFGSNNDYAEFTIGQHKMSLATRPRVTTRTHFIVCGALFNPCRGK